MTPLRIVAATASHADAIAALEMAAFSRPASPPTRELADPRYMHWIAIGAPVSGTADGNAELVVGYLQAMWLPDALDILAVASAPTRRRQGIAGALVNAAVAAARHQGLPAVTLEVAARNGPARGLYASLGFVDQGVRRNYYPARGDVAADDAVLMARSLD